MIRAARGLLLILAVLAAVVAAPGTASAGPGHHGTDPYATGCSQNSFHYTTVPLYSQSGPQVASVQVWYSRSCGTNWLVLPSNPAGGWADKDIWVEGQEASAPPRESDYGPGYSYTMQVYAPLNTCIGLAVWIFRTDGMIHGETRSAPGNNSVRVC